MKVSQLCFFFVAFLPTVKIFAMPSTLSRLCGRHLIACYLLCFALDFLLLQIILITAKGKSAIPKLLKNKLTLIPQKVILFLYAIYFLLKGIFFSAEQKSYIELSLYQTPTGLLTFLPFLIIAVYLSVKSFRTIGRVADITAIWVIIAVLILVAISLKSGDYKAFLPLVIDNPNGFYRAFKACLVWGGDCLYLLFMMKGFNYQKGTRLKLSIAYLIGGLLTTAVMVVFYAIFTYLAPQKSFAFTEMPVYSVYISNSARFDYIAIFVILFASIIGAVLPFYFSAYALNGVFNFKHKLIPAVIPPLIAFIVFAIFQNKLSPLLSFILKIFPYFALILGYLLPFLSPLLRKVSYDL